MLEELGVVIDLPPAASAQVAEEIGIAFLFAPLYHPALRYAGPPRRELGVPTVFNFLGPVANPARPQAQAVGVADPRMGEIIAGVLAGRGCSALVFHGDDGLDELTTATTSTVWAVHDSGVSRLVLDPAEIGLGRSRPGDLRGGDAARNAAVVRAGAGRRAGPGGRHGAPQRGRRARCPRRDSRTLTRWSPRSETATRGPAKRSAPEPPAGC